MQASEALEAAVPGSVVVGSSTWPEISEMFEAKPAAGGHMTIVRSRLPDDADFQTRPVDSGLLPHDVLLQASSTLEQYCHEGARYCTLFDILQHSVCCDVPEKGVSIL